MGSGDQCEEQSKRQCPVLKFLFVPHYEQEEVDQKSVMRLTWRKLLEVCERVTDNLQNVQGTYKKQLIRNVKVKKRIDNRRLLPINLLFPESRQRGLAHFICCAERRKSGGIHRAPVALLLHEGVRRS